MIISKDPLPKIGIEIKLRLYEPPIEVNLVFEKLRSDLAELALESFPKRCSLLVVAVLPLALPQDFTIGGGDTHPAAEVPAEPLAAFRILPGVRKNHGKALMPISRWSAEDRAVLVNSFEVLQSNSTGVMSKLSSIMDPSLVGKDLLPGAGWSESSSIEKALSYYYIAQLSSWIGLTERELRVIDEVIYARSGFNPRFTDSSGAGLGGFLGEVRSAVANTLFKYKGDSRMKGGELTLLPLQQEIELVVEFYLKEVRPQVEKIANWQTRKDGSELIVSAWVGAEMRVHLGQLAAGNPDAERVEAIEDGYAALERRLLSIVAERCGNGDAKNKLFEKFLTGLSAIRKEAR